MDVVGSKSYNDVRRYCKLYYIGKGIGKVGKSELPLKIEHRARV